MQVGQQMPISKQNGIYRRTLLQTYRPVPDELGFSHIEKVPPNLCYYTQLGHKMDSGHA